MNRRKSLKIGLTAIVLGNFNCILDPEKEEPPATEQQARNSIRGILNKNTSKFSYQQDGRFLIGYENKEIRVDFLLTTNKGPHIINYISQQDKLNQTEVQNKSYLSGFPNVLYMELIPVSEIEKKVSSFVSKL